MDTRHDGNVAKDANLHAPQLDLRGASGALGGVIEPSLPVLASTGDVMVRVGWREQFLQGRDVAVRPGSPTRESDREFGKGDPLTPFL